MMEKTVYMSGRLRPGGIELKKASDKTVSVVKGVTETVVTIPLMTRAEMAAKNRLNILLIPDNKTWAHRAPFLVGLNSPKLTVVSNISPSQINAKIEYNIPQFPDWLRSTVKSSIDGVVYILNVATNQSGAITDQGNTLLKKSWSEAAYAALNLPVAATDFIWVEHEYLYGGIVNTNLTPLPLAATTTTTTTAATTTTTTSTTTTTTLATTTTTTAPPGPTTTTPSGRWFRIENMTDRTRSYRCGLNAYYVDLAGGSGQEVPVDPDWLYIALTPNVSYQAVWAAPWRDQYGVDHIIYSFMTIPADGLNYEKVI